LNIIPRDDHPKGAKYDKNTDVLDLVKREEFKNETIFTKELTLFSDPISTTNTMGGYISNVFFHEEHLINLLEPDRDIVQFKCNYGKSTYPSYTEPVKQKTTNRGRKKKEKKKKPRKKQGNGEHFNSQITFVVRSPEQASNPLNDTIVESSKVYKFKVFRTGKLQLPGIHQSLIDDVIECAEKITDKLNQYLHPGMVTTKARFEHMNPIMKNYKFTIKIPEGCILNLMRLRKILFDERVMQKSEFNHPPIFSLKYTRQETKLSVQFTTPIFRKPKKKTRINIFMRGKVNILGAFYADATREICEYLHSIIENNYAEVVVAEWVAGQPIVNEWIPNIADTSDEETQREIDMWLTWIPPLRVDHLTNEELENINDLFHEITGDFDDPIG